MSFEYLNRALCEKLPPTPKVILICLANLADDKGYCHPTVDTIAEFAGVTRVTVSSTLRALEEAGVLYVRRWPGSWSTYRLNLGRTS